MLTELRTKSQITIPKDIVMKMGLREGDKLDELRSEINEAKAKIAAGEQPVFDTVDALFEALDGADE